ncbi:hypothetical protein F5Y06DRAFT_214450 [Hypoxylon sp. FL0890]|nr:hypothetical protein F5Y06DRAFT_214450 [Hypoxylon sp. FL0890]
MVVRTTSLNSLKNILPKIHQPLPLSPRESKQLLESITTSFRKNLDKEHPWELNNESTSQNPVPQTRKPLLATPVSSSSSPSDTLTRQRPTDRHLRAILSNPLFAHDENKDARTAPRDPIDVFNHAVSRGLMTPRRAAGFLAKVRSQIKGESADEIRQGMADSGAGLRVVQWLRASGLENDLHFIHEPKVLLFANLIPFMYAEGLEEVVWSWVARLGRRDVTDETIGGHFVALYGLLSVIMKQKHTSYTGLRTSLDGSYEAMVRANELLPKESGVAFGTFKLLWRNLSYDSTVLVSKRPKPSAAPFDAFVDVGRPLELELDLAHLKLHHPVNPDHSAAIKYMHHCVRSRDLDLNTWRRLVLLALDTTDRLKKVGDIEEVSWVERFLARIGIDLNSGIFDAPEKDFMASQLPLYRMD